MKVENNNWKTGRWAEKGAEASRLCAVMAVASRASARDGRETQAIAGYRKLSQPGVNPGAAEPQPNLALVAGGAPGGLRAPLRPISHTLNSVQSTLKVVLFYCHPARRIALDRSGSHWIRPKMNKSSKMKTNVTFELRGLNSLLRTPRSFWAAGWANAGGTDMPPSQPKQVKSNPKRFDSV